MARLASHYYPTDILHEAGGLTASIYTHEDDLGHYHTVEFDRYFRYDGSPTYLEEFQDIMLWLKSQAELEL